MSCTEGNVFWSPCGSICPGSTLPISSRACDNGHQFQCRAEVCSESVAPVTTPDISHDPKDEPSDHLPPKSSESHVPLPPGQPKAVDGHTIPMKDPPRNDIATSNIPASSNQRNLYVGLLVLAFAVGGYMIYKGRKNGSG